MGKIYQKVLRGTIEKRSLEIRIETVVENLYYCKTFKILKDITTCNEILDIAKNKLWWEVQFSLQKVKKLEMKFSFK